MYVSSLCTCVSIFLSPYNNVMGMQDVMLLTNHVFPSMTEQFDRKFWKYMRG